MQDLEGKLLGDLHPHRLTLGHRWLRNTLALAFLGPIIILNTNYMINFHIVQINAKIMLKQNRNVTFGAKIGLSHMSNYVKVDHYLIFQETTEI